MQDDSTTTIYADDLFVYAPTYDAYDRPWLYEGKGIGTVKGGDLSIAKKLLMKTPAGVNLKKYRTSSLIKARKEQAKLVRNRKLMMRALLTTYEQAKTKNPVRFKADMQKQQRHAMEQAFTAGVRASGKKVTTQLSAKDSAYLKSAISHEMRYFNKFMNDITAGKGRMGYRRRLDMYSDALEAIFQAGRVIGMPDNIKIYWVGPNDGNTCESCRYLIKNSPYTKYTLPTQPRSGATICLTRCRDRLLLSVVPYAEWLKMSGDPLKERERHIRALQRIRTKRKA